ncbi:hypothetical protein FSP39_014102 [Pinctada imbricata]|uniref:Uncharacterized protein n=1 Tax=Pinctada imbricata TaxID=66713 RepID=A0AA88XS52_PINIB|nr:hypothetical protein FSP39_014102 [Pinctada imbricata]
MKWKLSRGKFRPRLQQLVESNSEEEVESASKKAFKKLPNLKSAISELTVLKAVGPATASAVLAAGSPKHAAFMADESMLALPGLQPLQYTLNFYMSYMEQVKAITKRLQSGNYDIFTHSTSVCTILMRSRPSQKGYSQVTMTFLHTQHLYVLHGAGQGHYKKVTVR